MSGICCSCAGCAAGIILCPDVSQHVNGFLPPWVNCEETVCKPLSRPPFLSLIPPFPAFQSSFPACLQKRTFQPFTPSFPTFHVPPILTCTPFPSCDPSPAANGPAPLKGIETQADAAAPVVSKFAMEALERLRVLATAPEASQVREEGAQGEGSGRGRAEPSVAKGLNDEEGEGCRYISRG